MKQGRLENRVAIVTGGGRGFGRAIACRFAAEGAAVTLTARTEREIHETVAEITARGGRAQGIPSDVSSRADVDRVVHATIASYGPVSIMVNNAAITGPVGKLDEVNIEQWWAALAIDFFGPALYMHAVIPEMRKRKAGRIINVVSESALKARPILSAYNTSKWALMRLNEIVAQEVRQDGIGAFAIEPGRVMTKAAEATLPLMRAADPEGVDFFEQSTAIQDPEQVLAACAERCVALAAGPYLPLSGRFLEPEDNLDDLVAATPTQPGTQAVKQQAMV